MTMVLVAGAGEGKLLICDCAMRNDKELHLYGTFRSRSLVDISRRRNGTLL